MANHDNTSITTPRVEVLDVHTRFNGSQYTIYRGAPEELISVGLVTQAELDSIGKSGRKALPPTPGVECRNITRGAKVCRLYCSYADPDAAPYKTERHLPPLKVDARTGSDMCAGQLVTTYTGTRRQLILAGLATESMFPRKASQRRASKRSHPESGRWSIWREAGAEDRWSLTYYAPLREMGKSPYPTLEGRLSQASQRFFHPDDDY